MEYLTVKEFQQQFPGILKKLPITITRYGEEVATVLPVDGVPPIAGTTDEVPTQRPIERPNAVEEKLDDAESW